MKKYLRKIQYYISYLIAFLISYKFIQFCKYNFNFSYSSWIKKSFGKCGRNLYVEYPLYLTGGGFITIGDNFHVNARFRIDAKFIVKKPKIIIGQDVSINYDCHIGCINEVRIGDNVLIASKVYIADHSHGEIDLATLKIPPSQREVVSKGKVIIENNVWIGEGAAILPNVTIGEGSIVGANAVVTKNVPPYSIVGGVPAKIIKSLI